MKKLFAFLIIFSLTSCYGPFKKKPELLFVQSAKTATYEGEVLTLKNISKNVIYFSNRPYRLAGHISSADLGKIWNEKEKNSFKKDPPNVAISYHDSNGRPDVVIAEISDVKNSNNSASYNVKILKGKLPKSLREVVLFIDDADMIGAQFYSDKDGSVRGVPVIRY